MARVALVTGGGRGLGSAVARALSSDGWTVAIGYHTSEKGAQALAAEAGLALAIQADLRDPAQAAALAARAEAELGRVDALVNAAGGFHRGPLLEETPERWRDAFASNLDPVLFLARAVAPGMKARQFGRIVTFGMAGIEHLPPLQEVTAHGIAKAGVVMLTKALARNLAPDGITVNCVCPGFVGEVPGVAIPAGRPAAPDDVVAAVRYFLSDGAGYVTGAILPVSGGWGL